MRHPQLLLPLCSLIACGGAEQPAPVSRPAPQSPAPSPASTDTSTLTEWPDPSDPDPDMETAPTPNLLCEHIYDCGLQFEQDGQALDRSWCDGLPMSELSSDVQRCAAFPACADVRACLGIPEPPRCDLEAVRRRLVATPVWGDSVGVAPGGFVDRCRDARGEPCITVWFALHADGSYQCLVLTEEAYDSDGDDFSRTADIGTYTLSCDRITLTSCRGRVTMDGEWQLADGLFRVGHSRTKTRRTSPAFRPRPPTGSATTVAVPDC